MKNYSLYTLNLFVVFCIFQQYFFIPHSQVLPEDMPWTRDGLLATFNTNMLAYFSLISVYVIFVALIPALFSSSIRLDWIRFVHN